jgi:hypothetical protein
MASVIFRSQRWNSRKMVEFQTLNFELVFFRVTSCLEPTEVRIWIYLCSQFPVALNAAKVKPSSKLPRSKQLGNGNSELSDFSAFKTTGNSGMFLELPLSNWLYSTPCRSLVFQWVWKVMHATWISSLIFTWVISRMYYYHFKWHSDLNLIHEIYCRTACSDWSISPWPLPSVLTGSDVCVSVCSADKGISVQ